MVPPKDSAILCEQVSNKGGLLGSSCCFTVWGSNQSSDGWSIWESLTTAVLFHIAVSWLYRKKAKCRGCSLIRLPLLINSFGNTAWQ